MSELHCYQSGPDMLYLQT